MSFGFSIGDFLAVGRLALSVYTRLKSAEATFASLSTDIISLKSILDAIASFWNLQSTYGHDLDPSQKADLEYQVSACKQLLIKTEELLDKVERKGGKPGGLAGGGGMMLGGGAMTRTSRLKWIMEDVAGIRQELLSRVTMLAALNSAMSVQSTSYTQAKILEHLTRANLEHQAGIRVVPAFSQITSSGKIHPCTESTWSEIVDEVVSADIPMVSIQQNRDFIMDWIQKVMIHPDGSCREGSSRASSAMDNLSSIGDLSMKRRPASRLPISPTRLKAQQRAYTPLSHTLSSHEGAETGTGRHHYMEATSSSMMRMNDVRHIYTPSLYGQRHNIVNWSSTTLRETAEEKRELGGVYSIPGSKLENEDRRRSLIPLRLKTGVSGIPRRPSSLIPRPSPVAATPAVFAVDVPDEAPPAYKETEEPSPISPPILEVEADVEDQTPPLTTSSSTSSPSSNPEDQEPETPTTPPSSTHPTISITQSSSSSTSSPPPDISSLRSEFNTILTSWRAVSHMSENRAPIVMRVESALEREQRIAHIQEELRVKKKQMEVMAATMENLERLEGVLSS